MKLEVPESLHKDLFFPIILLKNFLFKGRENSFSILPLFFVQFFFQASASAPSFLGNISSASLCNE